MPDNNEHKHGEVLLTNVHFSTAVAEHRKLKTFRVTIDSKYTEPSCPGHTDPSARQGHYVRASTPLEAIYMVGANLTKGPLYKYTVQAWYD